MRVQWSTKFKKRTVPFQEILTACDFVKSAEKVWSKGRNLFNLA